MLIKLCRNCEGGPYYTDDTSVSVCPRCGNRLASVSVDPAKLVRYKKMDTASCNTGNDSGYGGTSDNRGRSAKKRGGNSTADTANTMNNNVDTTNTYSSNDNITDTSEVRGNTTCKPDKAASSSNRITVRGVVSVYKINDESTGYHRYWYEKLIQSLVYRQRFGEVMHSFYVTDENGNGRAYNVNVHGPLGMGARLENGLTVEVTGKMHPANVLMADSVNVLTGGVGGKVKFRRSMRAVSTTVLVCLALIFGIYCMIMANTQAGAIFLQKVKSFIITYVIIYIVSLVLYFSVTARRRRRRIPFGHRRETDEIGMAMLVLLVVALILTVMIFSSFSIGNSYSGITAQIFNCL